MLDNWYDVLLTVLTLVSTLIQIYVIWLVTCKSPKSMHEYRFFLCYYTVSANAVHYHGVSVSLFQLWDLIFTVTIGLLVHPVPLFPTQSIYVNGLSAIFGTTGAKVSVGNALCERNYSRRAVKRYSCLEYCDFLALCCGLDQFSVLLRRVHSDGTGLLPHIPNRSDYGEQALPQNVRE